MGGMDKPCPSVVTIIVIETVLAKIVECASFIVNATAVGLVGILLVVVAESVVLDTLSRLYHF